MQVSGEKGVVVELNGRGETGVGEGGVQSRANSGEKACSFVSLDAARRLTDMSLKKVDTEGVLVCPVEDWLERVRER